MDGDKKNGLFDRPFHERNQDKRLIIILEKASLETVKVSLFKVAFDYHSFVKLL